MEAEVEESENMEGPASSERSDEDGPEVKTDETAWGSSPDEKHPEVVAGLDAENSIEQKEEKGSEGHKDQEEEKESEEQESQRDGNEVIEEREVISSSCEDGDGVKGQDKVPGLGSGSGPVAATERPITPLSDGRPEPPPLFDDDDDKEDSDWLG